MSGMRWKHEMNERAMRAIGACCGPENGIWEPSERYWVCDYHEGYNDGLVDWEEWSASRVAEIVLAALGIDYEEKQ
jgi:hypothetical protein